MLRHCRAPGAAPSRSPAEYRHPPPRRRTGPSAAPARAPPSGRNRARCGHRSPGSTSAVAAVRRRMARHRGRARRRRAGPPAGGAQSSPQSATNAPGSRARRCRRCPHRRPPSRIRAQVRPGEAAPSALQNHAGAKAARRHRQTGTAPGRPGSRRSGSPAARSDSGRSAMSAKPAPCRRTRRPARWAAARSAVG